MVNHNGQSIIAVTGVFLAISFIAVSLRCYVRLRVVKAFGWDDGTMVLAMVCPSLSALRIDGALELIDPRC